jgi:hypothetical protein
MKLTFIQIADAARQDLARERTSFQFLEGPDLATVREIV